MPRTAAADANNAGTYTSWRAVPVAASCRSSSKLPLSVASLTANSCVGGGGLFSTGEAQVGRRGNQIGASTLKMGQVAATGGMALPDTQPVAFREARGAPVNEVVPGRSSTHFQAVLPQTSPLDPTDKRMRSPPKGLTFQGADHADQKLDSHLPVAIQVCNHLPHLRRSARQSRFGRPASCRQFLENQRAASAPCQHTAPAWRPVCMLEHARMRRSHCGMPGNHHPPPRQNRCPPRRESCPPWPQRAAAAWQPTRSLPARAGFAAGRPRVQGSQYIT